MRFKYDAVGMNNKASLTKVQWTALSVAHHRALESQRRDRLFTDSLAQVFVDAAGQDGAAAQAAPAAPSDYFAVRTRFFDDYLLGASRVCRQVVILGAGLDTRAFRLAWPDGMRVFEVDQPAISEFKESVLLDRRATPACTRVAVTADLRTDWPQALLDKGFANEPTAWLAEGLLFYLPLDDASRLLRRTADLSPGGSTIGVEHVNTSMSQLMAPITEELARRGAPWRSSIDEPYRWMAETGWHADVGDHIQAGSRYGRPLPDAESRPRAWLIEATKSP